MKTIPQSFRRTDPAWRYIVETVQNYCDRQGQEVETIRERKDGTLTVTTLGGAKFVLQFSADADTGVAKELRRTHGANNVFEIGDALLVLVKPTQPRRKPQGARLQTVGVGA